MESAQFTGVRGQRSGVRGQGVSGAVTHDVQQGVLLLQRHVLHVGSEALVQPQVVPPAHRHQVTEPLGGGRRVTSRTYTSSTSTRRTYTSYRQRGAGSPVVEHIPVQPVPGRRQLETERSGFTSSRPYTS